MSWEPIEDKDATSQLGEGIHTGLRKGTDAPEAPELWKAIRDSDGAWSDALAYAVWGLGTMGYKLCREVGDDAGAGRS